jgi:hypothetical protein
VVLVDTSVWIEVFRRPAPLRLDSIVDLEDVVTCLPVIQEVLHGFDQPRAFQIARESMYSLPLVESPLGREVFDQAVELYRGARRAALTIRSSVDCLIAACALRNELTVLHYDRDFELLARVSPLQVRSISRT